MCEVGVGETWDVYEIAKLPRAIMGKVIKGATATVIICGRSNLKMALHCFDTVF